MRSPETRRPSDDTTAQGTDGSRPALAGHSQGSRPDSGGQSTATRRRLLGGVAAGVGGALAGCGATADETPTASQTPTQTTRSRTVSPMTETDTPTATQEPTIAARIERAAVPVTTDPAASLDGIRSLASELADATVVGLGESTHGTREFFQLKHRLVRALVVEEDLRVFAWEGGFARTRALNQYVRHGEGDAASVLADSAFGVWTRDSTLSFVEWLRSYNEGRDPADQVRFYGYDTQFVYFPARQLQSFLSDVDADLDEETATALGRLTETPPLRARSGEELTSGAKTAASVAETLRTLIADNEATYVEATSERRVERAKRLVWSMDRARQVVVKLRGSRKERLGGYGIRDRSMAQNVAWIREFEDADTVAIWAHNGHVKDGVFGYGSEQTVPVMGRHLTEKYGEDYYALGLFFGYGAFGALNRETREWQTFNVAPPEEDTERQTLLAVDSSAWVLDFDTAPAAVREWLAEGPALHGAGAAVSPEMPVSELAYPRHLVESFDGIAFVDEGSATRPLE